MTKERTGDIFQQFILNSEELKAEVQGEADAHLLSSHERWEKVKHALQILGFSLMCAQSEVGGVPTVVIVGIPADCLMYLQIKDHFYGLVTKYHLPFTSGDWYLGEFTTRTSKSLLFDENYRAFITMKCDEQWFNEHHMLWVGFVGGELVAEGEDDETVLNQLKTKNAGQGGFYSQVLTEEEEDERAIQIP